MPAIPSLQKNVNKCYWSINFTDYVMSLLQALQQDHETSSCQSNKVTFIIMAAFRFVIERFIAMQSSVNGNSMWIAHCGSLMGLCWLSCLWSSVTPTGYWLQPQTTYDQYVRALQPLLQPLQFHWSFIAFHKRLQKWSLRQLASLWCKGSEWERVFYKMLVLFVIFTSQSVFVENFTQLSCRFVFWWQSPEVETK